jgi:hypothetical protein
MDRPRRDSRQRNGITVRGLPQPTFTTKSAQSRHSKHRHSGAPHIFTISVRYFGSRAAISLPFSAISSALGFGGGDVRPSTGNPTARKNSSCPAGVHIQSIRAVLSDTFLNACGALAGTLTIDPNARYCHLFPSKKNPVRVRPVPGLSIRG